MCNFILLSCDSDIDLTQYEGKFLSLKSLGNDDLLHNPETKYLSHPNIWLLTSKATPGCSCGFRHLIHMYHDQGFSAPEDWCEEDEEDVEATRDFFVMVKELVKKGVKLESFDLFDNNDGVTNVIDRIEVDTDNISADAFRFFEQVVFKYT